MRPDESNDHNRKITIEVTKRRGVLRKPGWRRRPPFVATQNNCRTHTGRLWCIAGTSVATQWCSACDFQVEQMV